MGDNMLNTYYTALNSVLGSGSGKSSHFLSQEGKQSEGCWWRTEDLLSQFPLVS